MSDDGDEDHLLIDTAATPNVQAPVLFNYEHLTIDNFSTKSDLEQEILSQTP